MKINDNIFDEISLLSNWLVSIPSISNTKGESVIIKAIYDGLSDFNYFKENKDNLSFITHEDQKNSSILALVENKEKLCKKTIILISNVDTQSAERFGQYKPYAFKSSDLKDKIIEHSKGLNYNPDDYAFGLGVLQCKFSCATMIALVKELSSIIDTLDVNIIFLCLSNSLKDNKGIKNVLEYFNTVITKKELKPILSICARPYDDTTEDKSALDIYTNNTGLLDIGFYILGKSATPQSPFSGFSSSLLTSTLCKNFELNPKILQSYAQKPQLPIFNYINYKQCSTLSAPDSIQISFSLPFFNLNIEDAIDEFKEICAKSIEECAELLDDRQNLFSSIEKKEFIPEVLDAEVLTFDELFKRASKLYKGDLHSAIDALIEKCKREGLASYQISHAIIDRLNDLCHLPRPSIVIYVENNYIPQQNIQNYSQQDRDTMLILDNAISSLKEHYPNINLSDNTFSYTDANFLHPIGLDRALNQIKPLSPQSIENYYYFNIPSVTLALKGHDSSHPTERIDLNMAHYMVDFITTVIECIENPKAIKSQESNQNTIKSAILSPLKKLLSKLTVDNSEFDIQKENMTKTDNTLDIKDEKYQNNDSFNTSESLTDDKTTSLKTDVIEHASILNALDGVDSNNVIEKDGAIKETTSEKNENISTSTLKTIKTTEDFSLATDVLDKKEQKDSPSLINNLAEDEKQSDINTNSQDLNNNLNAGIRDEELQVKAYIQNLVATDENDDKAINKDTKPINYNVNSDNQKTQDKILSFDEKALQDIEKTNNKDDNNKSQSITQAIKKPVKTTITSTTKIEENTIITSNGIVTSSLDDLVDENKSKDLKNVLEKHKYITVKDKEPQENKDSSKDIKTTSQSPIKRRTRVKKEGLKDNIKNLSEKKVKEKKDSKDLSLKSKALNKDITTKVIVNKNIFDLAQKKD